MNATEPWLIHAGDRPDAADPRLLVLRPGRARRLASGPGAHLTVMAGRVWLTQSDRAGDCFLDPGQSVALAPRGRVVVECLGPQSALIEAWPVIAGDARALGARWPARAAARLFHRLRQASSRGRPVPGAVDLAGGLGDLNERQLRDIGAPEAAIVSARAREQAARRWRQSVLDGRFGGW